MSRVLEWPRNARGPDFSPVIVVLRLKRLTLVGTAEAAGPEDVDAAVAAASAAFKGEWSTFTGLQRKNCITKLADLIEKRIPELARVETLSMGVPLMLSQHYLHPWGVNILRANAGYADKIEGQSFTDQDDGFYKVHHHFLLSRPQISFS